MELQDPVKMLVDMAKQGKIDPWNVDVVEVADKFLKELEEAKKLDLRISGRVLLYAAILVRMKAEILAEEAIEDETIENVERKEKNYIDEVVVNEVIYDETTIYDTYEPSFDDFEEDEIISYLLTPSRKVRRFTTLKDLLAELKKAEVKKRSKSGKKTEREKFEKQILETPHEEDIEDTIKRVEKELVRIFNEKGITMFSELAKGREKSEVLSYYISLLYLSFRKKIELEQKNIYEDDIIILPITEVSDGREK